jgi:anti-sigma B factor antagonist
MVPAPTSRACTEETTSVDETFAIATDRAGAAAVITVHGEIDIATAPQLREHLAAAVAGGGPVVVDLLGVSFLDSTALGALIGGLRASREADIPLQLVVAEPRILKVFEITGLDTVFTVVPTLADAVA